MVKHMLSDIGLEVGLVGWILILIGLLLACDAGDPRGPEEEEVPVGFTGDGPRCWDLNGNGVCDLGNSEDIDGDGDCTVLDCSWEPPAQRSMADGVNGTDQGDEREETKIRDHIDPDYTDLLLLLEQGVISDKLQREVLELRKELEAARHNPLEDAPLGFTFVFGKPSGCIQYQGEDYCFGSAYEVRITSFASLMTLWFVLAVGSAAIGSNRKTDALKLQLQKAEEATPSSSTPTPTE